MKLQVTQENLNRALNSVAKVANSHNTLPILSNVLLKTTKNRLGVVTTNLDIAINHFIGCKISKEGSITVPARLMQDFVSNLPAGVIDIELNEHRLHINTEQYQTVINGIASDEFPIMPTISEGHSLNIPTSQLKAALNQVVFAASRDEARPTLTGVYIHTNDAKLTFAATDSYRLAEKSLEIKKAENSNLLVPASAMQDVLRVLTESEDEVEMIYNDQQVMFRIGDIELVARLIEGTYPNYQQLIPQKFETSAKLARSELINITKVSSLFARESAGSITIKVGEDEVSIRAVASQLGENIAKAKASIKGAGEITLNSRYLLDALNTMNGENVVFSFNGKLEPAMLKNPDQNDYLHIIMPLKS